MGLRTRLKNLTNRSGSNSNTPTTGSGTSSPSSHKAPRLYKPGEEPRLKYRGKIDPAHTDKLHAFSFSDAWASRRKSHTSGTMSPGGTMVQSRAASFIESLRRKSVASGKSGSETVAVEGQGARRKSMMATTAVAAPGTVQENEVDDTSIANAGLSGPQTASGKPADADADGDADAGTDTAVNTKSASVDAGAATSAEREKAELNKTMTTKHDTPFSQEELEKAMTRATLEAPGGAVAAH